MKTQFTFKAQEWCAELITTNNKKGLIVEHINHREDPGAGANLVQSAFYHACELKKVSPIRCPTTEAQYPAGNNLSHSGGYCAGYVTEDKKPGKSYLIGLSNGQKLLIREDCQGLTIGNWDNGEPWCLCQIVEDAVTVYSNSSDGCRELVNGLEDTEDDEVQELN